MRSIHKIIEKQSIDKLNLLIGLSLFITILTGLILSMPRSSAASQATSTTASITVPSVCTMSGNETSAHARTIMNGSYETGIGETVIKSFCNDMNGYSIYAVGYTGDTVGNNKLHSDNNGSTYDIPTGITGSGSEWSMQVTAVDGAYKPYIDNGFDSSNYHLVPSDYTRVAYLGNATDPEGGTGSSIKTTYAARISATQPAGTYVGKVKYILIHPSGATAEEVPTMQSVADWKDTLLENEEIAVVDSRDNNTYTVAKLCVAKTNGNCTDYQIWMTQNLNFAPSASTTYTHADTDLGFTSGDTTETWTPQASTMTNPAVITNFASGNPSNSVSGWTDDNNQPHYAEGTTNGLSTGTEVIFYNGIKYEGVTDCVDRAHLTASQCEHYKVGNYYNWSAAVASNNTSSTTAQYTVMPNSICPAGWRLPNGLTNDNGTIVQTEFNAMLSANGVANGTTLNTATSWGGDNVGYVSGTFNTTFSNSPLYFVRSGDVNGTTLSYFSGYGYYWSSTAVSSSGAYNLGFGSYELSPARRNGRHYGFSVRCLVR